jgi:hypothetical protein
LSSPVSVDFGRDDVGLCRPAADQTGIAGNQIVAHRHRRCHRPAPPVKVSLPALPYIDRRCRLTKLSAFDAQNIIAIAASTTS